MDKELSFMSKISLIDIAKLLLISEEQNKTLNQLPVFQSPAQNKELKKEKTQKVESKNTTLQEKNKKYFTITKENFISTGLLFKAKKDLFFKLFKFKTKTEFENLSIIINNDVYISGDYKYYEEIGFGSYNPISKMYEIIMTNETYPDGVKITIDKGLNINLLTIIGHMKV